MRHKFVIIDDEDGPIATLADYLRAAFEGSSVVHDKKCATWSAAVKIIHSFPDDSKYVAFFDLSLEGAKTENAIAALESLRALRVQRRQWSFMAYSRFMETVEDAPDLDEIFDGRISKQRLASMVRTKRIDYVQKAVRDALAHRKGTAPIPDDADIVDSFGMRVFRLTFGDKAIAELLNAEAADWPAPRVEALTSGHSGAHLIQLSSGRESLVVKIARSASIIEHEIHAVPRNLSRLGAFAMNIARFDSEQKPLTGGAVYFRQATVFGRSLLSHVTSCSMTEAVKRVAMVAKFSIETAKTYRNVPTKGSAKFVFDLVDRGRFETSLAFLIPLAKTMAQRRLLKKTDQVLSALGNRMLRLLEGWDSNPVVTRETFLVLQHGDFNPGNVMLTSTGDLALIDLARFGDWPPGYDLARLALALRLRLVDRADQQDWLPFGLVHWLKEHVADIAPAARPSGTCRPAMLCDESFRKFIQSSPEADREMLRHGYRLGSMWDLIKIVSYQDVSQFKRLWALFELDRLASELGAFRS
jgi:hypothetical protein